MIIIDNESIDETYQIAKACVNKWNNSSVTIYKIKYCPLTDSRNFGLSKANGQYVFYIDADGEVQPGWCTELQKAISEGFDLFCGYVSCSPKANNIEKSLFYIHYKPSLDASDIPLIGANMGFRKTLLKDVNGFDSVVTSRGDESLILKKIIKCNPIIVVKKSAITTNRYPNNYLLFVISLIKEGQSSFYYLSDGDAFKYIMYYLIKSMNLLSIVLVPILIFNDYLYLVTMLVTFVFIRHVYRIKYYFCAFVNNTLIGCIKSLIIKYTGSLFMDYGYITAWLSNKKPFNKNDDIEFLSSFSVNDK